MGAADNLSANLSTIRKLRRMSQVNFARELGISKSTLQEIEQGHGPNLDTLECIAVHLGVPASALISNSSFPVQVGFLAPLLHGMDWFRDWSREDLDRFLDLSTQLLKLMKQYDQGQAFSSQPR